MLKAVVHEVAGSNPSQDRVCRRIMFAFGMAWM